MYPAGTALDRLLDFKPGQSIGHSLTSTLVGYRVIPRVDV